MNILLVYPQYPDTFWSFKHALRFVSRKAAFPPLGLLTVASMLPESWNRRLVDLNVTKLRDKDLEWADMVFVSAMIVQRQSAESVIARSRAAGVKVVAGGPLFTAKPEEFSQVDHLVLGEGEVTIPLFLKDLQNGQAQPVYEPDHFPAMSESPMPQWDLVNKRHYATMAVQYSRGCPFNCEFCDIIVMNGRVPRTKSPEQLIHEFDALYKWGWRGPLFIVDDNFIGNKSRVKTLLRRIIDWMKEHKYPFALFTEASLNMAEDEELMQLMSEANFNKVFIGLETPEEAGLLECSKLQNTGGDVVSLVRTIQNHGMEVLGGFIIGFDSDTPSIFENQIRFIQNLGVVTAMVGLLNALPNTRLYHRLKEEGRLLKDSTGNNLDISLNFVPKMDSQTLMEGYQRVLETIYSRKAYYERIYRFLENYRPMRRSRVFWCDIMAFVRSIFYLGILNRGRRYYWKLLIKTLINYPRAFPEAMTHAIMGVHFQKVLENYRVAPDVSRMES
jgi:radical SAM superfamily enzyme YgiQ (UPF0313 family)